MSYQSINTLYNTNINKIYIYSFTLNQVFIFPSFLTSISDDRKCNWSTNEIYGRMDSIYTYKNTTRKVSISFDVVPETKSDAIKIQEDLKIGLRKSIYPIYKERPVTVFNEKTRTYSIQRAKEESKREYALSSPPFHRIRFCNLIKSKEPFTHTDSSSNVLIQDGLLGWIDGYTFSPKVENGFFEDEQLGIFAKVYSVNLGLNVIHEHFLGYKNTDVGIQTRIEQKSPSEKVEEDESSEVMLASNALEEIDSVVV